MKSAHFIELDRLAEDTNERWSLSWKPDGYCEHFTKEAILSYAPAASGVYGLFNFDCQIFIGESANIREVLLRLEREGDFQSQSLRPTGFSFELCPHDSRKRKASELIARYRPALQPTTRVDEVPVGSREFMRRPGSEMPRPPETNTDTHEFPAHLETRRKAYPRASRAQIMLLSAILLAAGAAALFYFTPFDFSQISNLVGDQSPARVVRSPVPKPRQKDKGSLRAEMASKNNLAREANAGESAMPGQTEGVARSVKAAGDDDSDRQKFLGSENPDPTNDRAEKRWSVQVSAVPERDVADRLVQQLIAKGYDSYVVQAEVKGQTYYRVRAGRFHTRDEAESTRESLTLQESSRDAYVTTD